MKNQTTEEQLSPEELLARKEEMKQFYDESVPYLESQLKYEHLLTEIENARFKRATLQYQWASMMQNATPDEGEENESTENESPKERKLKKS